MPKVFLLDDESPDIKIAKARLGALTDDALQFEVAGDLETAEAILRSNPPGSLSPLFFDLIVPERRGGEVDHDIDWKNGLRAVELAADLGHRDHVAVLSAVSDWQQVHEARKALRLRGVQVEKWLSKNKDLVDEDDWRVHFGEWLEDLTPLVRRLRESHLQLAVVDPLQLELLRALLRRVRTALEQEGGRLPTIFLTGLSGEGKSEWARALCVIKAHLLGVEDGEIPFESCSLASGATQWDTDERIKLFGACRFSTHRAVLNEDGVLMRSTVYAGDPARPYVLREPGSLRPDRRRSGVCLLDEVLSAPPSHHDALLATLTTATVQPAGVTADSFSIGCMVAFASHIPLSDVVAVSDAERGPGQVSEAFLTRIGAPLRVPALRELAMESVTRIFDLLDKPLTPGAKDAVAEAREAGKFSFRTLKDVVKLKGRRVTDDQVREVLAVPLGPRTVSAGGPARSVEARPARALGTDGLPPTVSSDDFEQASAAWERIVGGDCAVRLSRAGRDLNLAPSTLLALVVVAYADLLRKRVTETKFNACLGLRAVTELRYRLRTLSLQYPRVWVGTGNATETKPGPARPVTMANLKAWATGWLELRYARESKA